MKHVATKSSPKRNELHQNPKQIAVEPMPPATAADAESKGIIDRYFEERRYHGQQTPADSATLFGLARYAWLLTNGREELRYKFTLVDVMLLQHVYRGRFFDPIAVDRIDLGVREHFGWNRPEDVPEDSRRLMSDLENLSPVGRCALVDVLERLWHVEQHIDGASVAQMLSRVGLELRV